MKKTFKDYFPPRISMLGALFLAFIAGIVVKIVSVIFNL